MNFDAFPKQEPNKTEVVNKNQEVINKIGESLDELKHSGTAGFALAWENIGRAFNQLPEEKQKSIVEKHGKTMDLWNDLNQRVNANNMDNEVIEVEEFGRAVAGYREILKDL